MKATDAGASIDTTLDQGMPVMPRRPIASESIFPSRWPGEPIWTWLAVSMACVLVTYGVSRQVRDPMQYFATYAVLSVGFVAVPAALQIGFCLFSKWIDSVPGFMTPGTADSLTAWAVDARRFASWSVAMPWAGASLAALTIGAEYAARYFDGQPPAVIAWSLLVALGSSFFAGAGLYAMFSSNRAIWRLGLLEDCEPSLRNHRFGLLGTGRTLALCYLMITLVWLVYSASAVFKLPKLGAIELLKNPPVLMLAVPTLPAIFVSFIACQFPLHERMATIKAGAVARVEALLQQCTTDTIEALTDDRRGLIEFLQRQRAEALDLPEWPFTVKSLVGLGGSSLIAISPIILKFAPDLFKLVVGRAG